MENDVHSGSKVKTKKTELFTSWKYKSGIGMIIKSAEECIDAAETGKTEGRKGEKSKSLLRCPRRRHAELGL